MGIQRVVAPEEDSLVEVVLGEDSLMVVGLEEDIQLEVDHMLVYLKEDILGVEVPKVDRMERPLVEVPMVDSLERPLV